MPFPPPLPPAPPSHSPRPICDPSGAQPDSGEDDKGTPTRGSGNGARFTAQEEGIGGV